MSAVRCTFPSVAAGCQAVNTAIQMGESVVRIELLDADCMAATNAYSKVDPPPNPHLLLEFHGSESELVAQAITFREIADQFGCPAFEWKSSPEEHTRLWQVRQAGTPSGRTSACRSRTMQSP